MNSKQFKTLTRVHIDPVLKDIRWHDIEVLLCAVGAQLIEGSGSRVRFRSGGLLATFHRPHPGKDAKPYQVRDVRIFLEKIGVRA